MMRRRALAWTVVLAACGPSVGLVGNGDGTATGGAIDGSTFGVSLDGSTGGPDPADSTGSDSSSSGDPPSHGVSIDVLFVIDDGPSMREEQANVARNLVAMMHRLETLTDSEGNQVSPSLQVMVTRASASSPRCRGGDGGMPVGTACLDRLDAFDDPTACESVCPEPVVPDGDFIAIDGEETNVALESDVDLDGDGEVESPATRALGCLGPQGTGGCPYGAPLEAIRLAVDPDAMWNGGPRPFLRDDVPLAIVVVSDGVDCSGADVSAIGNDAYWEVDPMTGMLGPSPAVCWNAGVDCEGPDADGWYSECTPTASPLFDVAAYLGLLEELREIRGKEVVLLGALGVPPVTAHGEEAPFPPTEGGLEALVPRQWTEGDLLPADASDGLTIEDKHFATGIGPGCTELDREGEPLGQASPSLRVAELCKGLDRVDDNGEPVVRCCIESICDEDFSVAINCLAPGPSMLLPPGG